MLVRTGYGTEAEVRAAKDAPLLAMAPGLRSKKGGRLSARVAGGAGASGGGRWGG